jgi:hypothetical protein
MPFGSDWNFLLRWHLRSAPLEPPRATLWLTHARGTTTPAGTHRSKGWGGAALLVLMLDTRRRMEEGRTRQG